MIVLKLAKVKAKCWRGYTKNRTGFLPSRMSWMQPDAAKAFTEMNEASNFLIECTDVFRPTMNQIKAIAGAPGWKKRLYAPPTKSGHNFGWSIDIGVKETLENFKKSGVPELVAASKDRHSLGLWMKQFGWTGIKSENWHFNFLGDHSTTVQKIDALYGDTLKLSNEQVQECLNHLLKGKIVPLKVDGVLGLKSSQAGIEADKIFGTKDKGSFSAWFRRVLAGATAQIEEVGDNG